MYCKNCGRQLKEGMRFCDRCGQSVRKNNQNSQTAKRQEIEELKAERLNRKKRLAEKEAKQALNKKRKKKKGNIFIFIIVVILIGAASCIIGYKSISSGEKSIAKNDTASQDINQSSASAQPSAAVSNTSEVKNGYASISIGNLTCQYPSNFHSNTTTSANEKLNLTDPLGGATMVIAQDGKSGEPRDLMREYVDEIGGSVPDNGSRAGNDWYTVTIYSGDKVYHRKAIIRNGITVYYDFIYNQNSSSESKYKEYIEHMDSNFK